MPKWKSKLQQAVVEWLTAHPDVSRAELARRAGIDKASVVKIANGEKDNLNGDSAVALAGVMGISVEDLYAGRAVPAMAAAPIDATTDVRGVLRMLALSQLAVNPLNPRKAFKDEHLDELAESIAADGILQNLVVTPAGKDGRHVVIAGGRRQRALMKLAEAGRWAADAPTVPCRVLAGDEPRVRALALIENLQRVDLAPMEEAEAFAELVALDPATWTTARIADTVHRTQRFVQQRLAIATKLTAKAKKALADGTITVESARLLVAAPMKRQAEIIDEIERSKANGWHVPGPDEIRDDLMEDWVPVDVAAFDLSLYAGEIVEDDDGRRYFTDHKQFESLQRDAAKAKAAELEGQRAWVKIAVRHDGQHFSEHTYNKAKRKDLSDTGAFVVVGYDWRVEVHDGLMQRTVPGAGREAAGGSVKARRKGANGKSLPVEKPDPQPYTAALLTHAWRTKSAALQDAIARTAAADAGDTAITLAIVGLLGNNAERVKIAAEQRHQTDTLQGGHVRARLATLFDELKPRRRKGDDESRVVLRAGYDDGVTAGKAWEWLRAKTPAERVEIFALLVADQCGYFVGYGKPEAYHEAFDVALAYHVGLDMTAAWRPDQEWLDGSRKARLEALARTIRLDPMPKSTGQLREAIRKRFEDADKPGGAPLPPAADWVPPEVRVLDKAGFAAAFKASAKPPAERRSPAAAAADVGDSGEEAPGLGR